LLKDGKFILKIFKRLFTPAKYSPSGVLAVDFNEKQIVVGNRKRNIGLKQILRELCIINN
jgi:hypothetical protein